MEPAGDAPRMQSRPWKDYLPGLSFQPHLGQGRVFEVAANEVVGDKLIVLPTGYGKTRTGAGYYVIRRERNFFNRCLWVVSSAEQLRQLSPEPDKRTGQRGPTVSDRITEWFGVPCGEAVTVTGAGREVIMHQRNRAEIFVTSYQFLRQQVAYFAELMDDEEGRWQWLVIGDEAHHLGRDGSWAAWLQDRIPRRETLYMSATPLRTDKLPLKNVPSRDLGNGASTYNACVEVSWREAIDEYAIRQPRAHVQEWQLEFKNRQGESVTLTTSQLKELHLATEKDFDAWVVKRDLRYTVDYVQRIIIDALTRLNEKRATRPGPHQMIVFAMSCGHAKFLANEVFPNLDILSADADWIGVNRDDPKNKEVMESFKRGELSVLVQVDKAGEGFDHAPASVALFLNLIQSQTKLLQQLGRVMRRQFHILPADDTADVFADASHPVIEVVRSLEPEDAAYDDPKKEPGGGGGDGMWPSLPELQEIAAKWLKTEVVVPDGTPIYPPGVIRAAEQFNMSPDKVQELLRIAQGTPVHAAQSGPRGEVGLQAVMQQRVDSAMSAVAFHAIRLTATNGGVRNGKQLAGQIKKNLNTRWKAENMGHDQMLSEDFSRKYTWLRGIDEVMKQTKEVPSWLIQHW